MGLGLERVERHIGGVELVVFVRFVSVGEEESPSSVVEVEVAVHLNRRLIYVGAGGDEVETGLRLD